MTQSSELRKRQCHQNCSTCVADWCCSTERSCKGNGEAMTVFKTICFYLSCFTMGTLLPLFGNTIVHMTRLFEKDMATVSFTFTSMSFGYLVGSILCGFIYDRVDPEFSFVYAHAIVAIFTAIAPFVDNYGGISVFFLIVCVQKIATAYIDAAGQTYGVQLWKGRRYSKTVLQFSHAFVSFGGVVEPFIMRMFISNFSQSATVKSVNNSADFPEVAGPDRMEANSILIFANATPPPELKIEEEFQVRCAFVAHGLIPLLPALLYGIAFVKGCSHHKDHSRAEIDDSYDTKHLVPNAEPSTNVSRSGDIRLPPVSRSTKVLFSALVFVFYLLLNVFLTFPMYFLNPFAVYYLNFTIYDAALTGSAFYGTRIVGTIVGAVLLACLKPGVVLAANIALTLAAFALLLGIADIWPNILWVSMAVAGFGISTTFMTTVLWISKVTPVTGKVSSIIFTGYSIGGVAFPILIGQLFVKSTPMWCLYVTVAAAVCHVFVFAWLVLIKKSCESRR